MKRWKMYNCGTKSMSASGFWSIRAVLGLKISSSIHFSQKIAFHAFNWNINTILRSPALISVLRILLISQCVCVLILVFGRGDFWPEDGAAPRRRANGLKGRCLGAEPTTTGAAPAPTDFDLYKRRQEFIKNHVSSNHKSTSRPLPTSSLQLKLLRMLIFSRIFTLLFVLLAIGMVADAAGSRRDRYCGRQAATTIMATCGSPSCENHKGKW